MAEPLIVALPKGRLTEEQGAAQVAETLGLITGTTSYDAFGDVDFVVEAVPERMEIKQAVFAEIEQIVADDAVLATNTSSLSVAEIGAKLAHPERLVGFHFFNPVAVMPLIEVVRVASTSDEALATAMATAKKLGKTAVITAAATSASTLGDRMLVAGLLRA